MPNVISPRKRSVTFLESREVFEWMEEMARVRQTDVSVILRDATSAYYLQHQKVADDHVGLLTQRSETKAAARMKTAKQIASGKWTPAAAQERNAPIHKPVRVVNLWPSITRHVRSTAK